jgi:hypothetical protein
MTEQTPSLFVDCGAPSLYNKLSRRNKVSGAIMGARFKDRKHDDFSYTQTPDYAQYRAEYIAFLKQYQKDITVYTNLDVINNAKLTRRNQGILERAGLSPIPVFHLGSDETALEEYLKNPDCDYIALGGLIPNRPAELYGLLDRLFQKYFLNKDGHPKIKVHGLACTSASLMVRYPWYSVDSTSSLKMGIYGKILVPKEGFPQDRIGYDFIVSSRDIPLAKRHNKPRAVAMVEAAVNRAGFTLESLSNSRFERILWNHLQYVEFIYRRIPLWPWSIKTRQSKKGAHEQFSLYFAGSLSKKEEADFWKEFPIRQKMLNRDYPIKRLNTFFSKEQIVNFIDDVIHKEEPNEEKNSVRRTRGGQART